MPSRIKEQISDYYKNSYLSYKSHYYFLGPPITGASLSCRYDKNYLSPIDFCGTIEPFFGSRDLTIGSIVSSSPFVDHRFTSSTSTPIVADPPLTFNHALSIELDEKNFLLQSQQVEGMITAHKLHGFVVNP